MYTEEICCVNYLFVLLCSVTYGDLIIAITHQLLYVLSFPLILVISSYVH